LMIVLGEQHVGGSMLRHHQILTWVVFRTHDTLFILM
jgi:hypothetical protein